MLKCQEIPELTSALLDDQLSRYQRWQESCIYLFVTAVATIGPLLNRLL